MDLSKDSEYENLMLECYDLVDDMKYFEGVEDHFFELLENLRDKVNEIMKLLSTNNDDLSSELLYKMDDVYSLCNFY